MKEFIELSRAIRRTPFAKDETTLRLVNQLKIRLDSVDSLTNSKRRKKAYRMLLPPLSLLHEFREEFPTGLRFRLAQHRKVSRYSTGSMTA